MREIKFKGLIFRGLELSSVIPDKTQFKHVITVNAEFIVKSQTNERLGRIINDNVSTFDGQIPYLLAKYANQKTSFEKISGADLIYTISEYAGKNDLKLFLLGGTIESNSTACKRLNEMYNTIVSGYCPKFSPYPFDDKLNSLIKKKILDFKPDIIFVGFGAIKQEFWIDDNRSWLEEHGVRLAVGCGGTFEFVSKIIRRAPQFIQDIGLEIVFRFLQQPNFSRLKRIFISLKMFFIND